MANELSFSNILAGEENFTILQENNNFIGNSANLPKFLAKVKYERKIVNRNGTLVKLWQVQPSGSCTSLFKYFRTKINPCIYF